MSVQSQYRNLHHLSFWEMAISNLGLWEIEEALKCWRNLHKESTVNEHFKYKCAELTGLLFFFFFFFPLHHSGQRRSTRMASRRF